jgi:dienelactone hydrolase
MTTRRIAFVFALVLVSGCYREAPVPETPKIILPKPTGPHVVGRTSQQWTDFMVHVWYPMRPEFAIQPAPYVPNVELLQSKIDDSYFEILKSAGGHAFVESAPTLDSPMKHPIVVFSHGNQMSAFFYAAIEEDLASHGYVVISIDHPREAMFTIFPDGKVVAYAEPAPVDAAASFEVVEAGFRRILEKRAQVIASVIDGVPKLFSGSLDLSRVAVVGHSIGGVAASLVCELDPRVAACANLDGRDRGAPFFLSGDGKGPVRPFLYFAKPLRADDSATDTLPTTLTQYNTVLAAVLARDKQRMTNLQTDSYRVILQGATHDTFSDAPLLLPSSSEEKAANVRRNQIVREYLRAFLDRYLKSATMTVLDEPKPRYPEIELDAKRSPLKN